MTRSSSHTFLDDEKTFNYTLHRKSGQKHRYIRIKNGEAIVTAPYMTSIEIIESFVRQKSDWIIKHLNKPSKSLNLTRPNSTIFWLGEEYRVVIIQSNRDHLTIRDGVAIFHQKEKLSHANMLKALQNYYKQHAPRHINPKIEAWAVTMNLHPSKISFRRAKTRWGSCSSKNTISLNTYLLMLPNHLIDYIIVHELAHIMHKNHSKAFWKHVEQYLPQYKIYRKQIRKYESYLL